MQQSNSTICLFCALVLAWLLPPLHSFSLFPRTQLHSTFLTANYQPGWFPVFQVEQEDDIYQKSDDALEILEAQSVILAADLIRARLNSVETSPAAKNASFVRQIEPLVRGRFMDLTCTAAGEQVLENIFLDQPALIQRATEEASMDVLRGAVLMFQSLCAMATQVGVRGPPEQLRRMVAHLDDRNDRSLVERDFRHTWDRDSVRRLKYRIDRSPAIDLLTELMRKRTPQGAFDLLVQLGAWEQHEDLALLRSGFPLRFTDEEEELAKRAFQNDRDPDSMLGIRKDFRYMKVYTIDGASTSEIDDGLSLETLTNPDGSTRNRIWVHIADADRWAPRDSKLLEIGRQRITSLYLPRGSISMFPSSVSADLMALQANKDSYALSLGVELNEDGSVDPNSLILTPSIIRVTYRLTYDEVDEMLEEGIGYREEWELGALLSEAKKRRKYRCSNGSSEQLIPRPIPTASISVYSNQTHPDEFNISLNIQVAYNSGKNQSKATMENPNSAPSFEDPVSSSYLLVTEAMILSGECLGHWKTKVEQESMIDNGGTKYDNSVRLAFRAQPKPEFLQRSREYQTFLDLLEYNVGDGYCHAWYGRRFLQGAKVSESRMPHAGLGLSSYVQWTSPIRRFSDLQVHACIKRYLRRNRVYELWRAGKKVPDRLTALDLGLPQDLQSDDGRLAPPAEITTQMLDQDIDFLEGGGLLGAARTLQKRSQEYWHFEYIRRNRVSDAGKIYDAVILGIVDPAKRQHAIYIHELGLEHRYTSPAGLIDPGVKLKLLVDEVSPRHGLLSFVRTL